MHKSFLQQVGESMSGYLYGFDIYDFLNRQEAAGETETTEDMDSAHSEMKALKEKNKHH